MSHEEILHTLINGGDPGDIMWRIIFSLDGEILAKGISNRWVALWDTASRNLLYSILAHPDAITTLAFSPDGK